MDHLDLPGRHPVCHHGGGVHWGIVPMEPPNNQPFLLENLHGLAQGIHDLVGVHHGPPGHVVGVDEAFRVKEGQDHLLSPLNLDLGLDGARLALFQPLPALLV
jgi:hypothetical protein